MSYNSNNGSNKNIMVGNIQTNGLSRFKRCHTMINCEEKEIEAMKLALSNMKKAYPSQQYQPTNKKIRNTALSETIVVGNNSGVNRPQPVLP